MEIDDLMSTFKVVALIEGSSDTELLGRGATLPLARALYRAAVMAYPKREIWLRHGARIIEHHAPGAAPSL